MKRPSYKGLLAVVALAILPAPVQALTLADLTTPGTSWTQYQTTISNVSFSSTSLQASDVTVEWFGNYLYFTGNLTGGANTPLDAQISYDIRTTEDPSIRSINMYSQGTADSDNEAYVEASIGRLLPGGILHVADLHSPALNTQFPLGNTYAGEDAYPAFQIVNTIHANAGFSVTLIANGFWNNTGDPAPMIPEPATLTLIPLALAGLAVRKKLAR